MANMAAAEGISKEKALQKIRTSARNVPTARAKTSSTSSALSAPPAPKAPMLRVDTGEDIELINMDDYVAVEDYDKLRDEFEEQTRRIALLDKEVKVRNSSHAQLEVRHRKLELQVVEGSTAAKDIAEKQETKFAKVLSELMDTKKQSNSVHFQLRSVDSRISQMETGFRIREDNQKKKIEENFAVNNTLAGVVSTMTSMMNTLREVQQSSSLTHPTNTQTIAPIAPLVEQPLSSISESKWSSSRSTPLE